MPGLTVAGRYQLEGMLGHGGSAEVWRATDLVRQQPVVLKLLRAGADEAARERFRTEARRAVALQHPGIAAVHDVGESADGVSAWIVLELVEGEPLSAQLQREGPLTVACTLDVVGQVAEALQVAQRLGVVHAPVTPDNLVVRPGGAVTVTDVGVLPPVAGGPAADVVAVGVVAHACLSGLTHPGDAPVGDPGRQPPDLPPLPDAVPPAVRALVLRCLAPVPADRPADVGELARAVRTLQTVGEGGAAVPRSRLRARHLTLPLVLVLGALLALGVRLVLSADDPSTAVPLVRAGSSAPEARQLLADAGLRVRWRNEVDPDVPEDRVVRTEPAGGSRVAAGSDVVVVVSGEVLVGRPYAEVRRVLVRRRLLPRPVADAEGGAPGTVRRLEPDGPLEPGSEVLVHVVPGGSATAPTSLPPPIRSSGAGA